MLKKSLQGLLVGLVVFCCISCNASSHPSSVNCTWKYIPQPLSHFHPVDQSFQQRLCMYSEYYSPNASNPIFLYTGNESPVEEYVNNTGLMWDLAAKMNALIIFAEHRYFGKSIPKINGVEGCVQYLTSMEALADYATLTNLLRRDVETWGAADSAIIAFGGSYGGMLASWMRTLYPSAIDGAIAASAPIWGFPLNSCPLDGSAQVVAYATSQRAGCNAYCTRNLKVAYVLLQDIGQTAWGRQLLSSELNLCEPISSTQDISQLLSYLQSPLFNLAEGSYPFPSNYITYALTGESESLLPPWALQVMCQSVNRDYGVNIVAGSEQEVKFTVADAKKSVLVEVDWDATSNNGYSQADLEASSVMDLLRDTLQSIQVWYNVSQSLPSCYDYKQTQGVKTLSGKRLRSELSEKSQRKSHHSRIPGKASPVFSNETTTYIAQSPRKRADSSVHNICTAPDSIFDESLIAWDILTCNEGINLVNWRVQGVGNEQLYWPPNAPRDYSKSNSIPGSLAYCSSYQALGLYGIPENRDDWAFWIDSVYGGTRNEYTTNIVYSNGDLDPWMAAGVDMVVELDGRSEYVVDDAKEGISSFLIKQGGHHLDLFWSDENDPASVRQVRTIEEEKIRAWIAQKKTKMTAKKINPKQQK